MQITQVSYPQPDLCCLRVREDAAAYEAAIEQQYQQFGKFYSVPGYEKGQAPRAAIEAQVGMQVFRLEAINQLLTYQFAALQAEFCLQQGLVPLTEAEPHLLSDDETGFAVDCTFALVPTAPVSGYAGNALPGDERSGVKALLDQVAAACGVQPCDWAVQYLAESRRDALEEKLREGKTTLAEFLRRHDKTEADLAADLAEAVRGDLAQTIVLMNVARQEGLQTTPEQLEAELARMEAISEQNRYARSNPSARLNIAKRLTVQRTLEWLRAHNTFETN